MTKIRAVLLCVFLLQCCWSSVIWADIYAYTDEAGSVHFSNIPDDPRFKSILKTPRSENAVIDTRHLTIKQKLYGEMVNDAAKFCQLESALVHAVIAAESGYNPQAKSNKGAIGLMQLMPATAKRYGITNLYDPAQNIQAGTQYLRDLMHLFNNDLSLTIAAYNAGENAVIRNGNQIPPYAETRLYVPKVLKFYNEFLQRSTR